MNLRRLFCVALFGFASTMPWGCGDPNAEPTAENDPLVAEPDDDPTLSEEDAPPDQ